MGAGGLDRYAYVNNAPVNLTDPSGHCIWDGCLLEIALVVTVSVFTLTGDTIQPAPAPIDTNASDLSDLIQLGIDHTEHANIVGEGLKSLQDDPSVQSAQRNIVDIITGKPEYGEQSYSLNDLSDDFTANGPTGNWYLAPFGSGRHAFWMVHTATISATDIWVSSDGTISTTWKIDDKFDYIPSEEKGFWYNLFAKTINPIYTGLLNAKEQYPTTTQWKQIIPPPMICRRCNESQVRTGVRTG